MRALLATAMLCVVGLTAALARDVLPFVALARDDGRYADAPLKSWFDRLASGKGLCCSFADGAKVADVDWDTVCEWFETGGSPPLPDGSRREQTENCRYRVRLHGEWIDVPPSAVVEEPNRFCPAVVWPYLDTDGAVKIRCFLPGAGA